MSTPLSIQDIFRRDPGATYEVTMVLHATDGHVGYATGSLVHKAPFNSGPFWRSASLTTNRTPLPTLFSNRFRVVDPVPDGAFAVNARQPFDVDRKDEIGLAVYESSLMRRAGGENGHSYGATLTFVSPPAGRISIGLDPVGDLLFGLGPKVDGVQSSYTLSFRTIDRPR